jgi:hypothetical protein
MKNRFSVAWALPLALLAACNAKKEAAPSTKDVAVASSAAAPASAPPSAAPTASAAVKEYDCGKKGQKPCPMQGWMKTVLTDAVASEEGAKVAAALTTLAGKAPVEFADWKAIAMAGAAKAKDGDIEAAKASCKQCHDIYKEAYKKTMRDRPF